MRRKLGFILTMMLVLGGLLLAVVPAQAQSPLADVRERVNGILVQLRTFDNTCVIILSALLKEVDIDILDARRQITVGKGNLNRLLLEAIRAAQNGAQRVIDLLDQCRTLLGEIGDDVDSGTIFGEVNEVARAVEEDLCELEAGECANGLDTRKFFKIRGLIDNIVLTNLGLIRDSIDAGGKLGSGVQTAFDDIEAVEGDLDGGGELCAENDNENVVAVPAVAVPQVTEKGCFTFQELRDFKIELGRIHQQIVQLLREVKRFTHYKKWVLKAIKEIYWLLRASNFGGRAAGELSGTVAQVYTLNGKRVNSDVNGSLNVSTLTNGVYLVVYDDGRVEKLVVAR
jgi:hypothetical protein